METVTLPLPFVFCFGGFLLGVFATLMLVLDRRQAAPAPTIFVERNDDRAGCGLLMLLVSAALGVFLLVSVIAT